MVLDEPVSIFYVAINLDTQAAQVKDVQRNDSWLTA